jgi:hypothetical protein
LLRVHAIRGAIALIIWKIKISTYGLIGDFIYLQHNLDRYGFKEISLHKLGQPRECTKT